MHADGVHRGEAEGVGAAHDLVALPLQLALRPRAGCGWRCRWRRWSPRSAARSPPRPWSCRSRARSAAPAARPWRSASRPGAPMTRCGRSPSKTIEGTTELKRALPGARLPARPGPRVEHAHAAVVHEAQARRDHARRHAERMGHGHAVAVRVDHGDVRGVLSRRAPALKRGTSAFSPRADLARPWPPRRPSTVSRSTGTSTNFGIADVAVLVDGGALHRLRDDRGCTPPSCARARPRSKCSRMFSISSSITPPPGGWLVETR